MAANEFFADIIEFNDKLLNNTPDSKGLLDMGNLEFIMKALQEEADEFAQSHMNQDYIGSVDAIGDLIYFAIGALHKMGLDEETISKCFKAIHEANMEKKAGIVPKRAGAGVVDAVKPQGWVSPEERIAAILDLK